MFRRAAVAVCALIPVQSMAASDDAWTAFRVNVGETCRALVTGPGQVTVAVNPFGSASFGAALVTVTDPAGNDETLICIYRKTDGTAELTAPFAAD